VADDAKQMMIARAVGMGTALAASFLVQQLINGVWRATAGHKPPKADDDSDARFGEVAAAAIITGALIGLARVLATRGAAKIMH